ELAAGVVDQDVDPAELAEHGGDERLDLRRLADVAGPGDDGAAGGAQLLGGGVELVLGPAADRDARAEPHHLACGGQADAAAAAGDDGDLIAKDAGGEDALGLGAGRLHALT